MNIIHQNAAEDSRSSIYIPGQRFTVTDKSNALIQQVKAAGVNATNSVNQGLPKPLTNVVISRIPVSSGYQVRVSFQRDPTDLYFRRAVILLKQGNAPPVSIGSGETSPITVILPKSHAASAIMVQAEGNWGALPIASASAKGVSLR